MAYNRNELDQMTLQKLASLYPEDLQQEELIKEIFDLRAKVSSYQTLTTLDVKQGWQEEIVQKYVDEKRENMPPENPAELTPEEESNLDAAVITKEKELELQAKLDKRNAKRKGIKAQNEPVEAVAEPVTESVEAAPEVAAEAPTEAPKRRAGRPKKT